MMYYKSISAISKYFYLFILLIIISSGTGSKPSVSVFKDPALQSKDSIQHKDTAKGENPVRDTFKQQMPGQPDTVKQQMPGQPDTVKQQIPGQPDTVQRQLPDSVVYQKKDFSAEDLIRGERLFYGLVYVGEEAVDCAHCHNTRKSDSLNWNPDAYEISLKYLDKSAFDLSRVLLKPAGQHMRNVHKDLKFSAGDIVQMKAYMDLLAESGIIQSKPVITNLLILIIASGFFLFAIADLLLKRFFRKRINWLVLCISLVVITWILAENAIAFGRAEGFSPDQPIKFSHAVHAGQNKTDCIYCHYSAKISKTAGIPASSICWNCHFLVRNGTRSGTWEVSKIVESVENGNPVEWVRIYKLPDFVYFNHSQHVTAGEIDCVACHGDVKTEDRLTQVNDLSMGWCLDCHETRKVNVSNEYYKTYYPVLHHSVITGKRDSIMAREVGGWDCMKCHY